MAATRPRPSFDDFYRSYWDRVVRFAARQFGPGNAEDVAQEAMLRAYRAYDALDASQPVWPWLTTVTYHAGVDLVRSTRRAVPTDIDQIEEIAQPVPDLPAVAAVAWDTRRRLGRALQRLTARDRSALELYEVDGRPVAEIAAMFNTSENTVRQRLFRARRHLAAEYQAAGGQPALAPWFGPAASSWLQPGRLVERAARVVSAYPGHLQDHAAMAAAAVLAMVVAVAGAGPRQPAAPQAPVAVVTAAPDGMTAVPPVDLPPLPVGVPSLSSRAPDDLVEPLARGLLDYREVDGCHATRALRPAVERGLPSTCHGEPPRPAPVPAGAEHHEGSVTSADGTLLHADVLLPAGHQAGQRHPVVLVAGPYLTDRAFPYPELWEDGGIFARGYAYVQVTLRGRGSSGGCADFGGPGEQADAHAAVEWAASQPWSSGRVGMWGLSYDGWAAVMALAARPSALAAAVVGAPLVDLYSSLYDDGVRYQRATWPAAHLADIANAGRGDAGALGCYADDLAAMADDDPGADYWQVRDLRAAAGRATVPALWSHGFADPYAPAAGSVDVFGRLAGPARGFFGQFGHSFLEEDAFRDRWFTEAMGWLDRFVVGVPGPVPLGVVAERSSGPPAEGRTRDDVWRAEAAWPPADATLLDLPLLPGAYADAPGRCATANPCPQPVPRECNELVAQCAGGSATFSQPLPYDVHVAGPVDVLVRRAATGRDVTAIALVYDVDPSGGAALLTRGAVRHAGPELRITLDVQDWRLPRGHRLGVVVTGADDGWYAPEHSGTTVVVEAAVATVRFLRYERGTPLARDGFQGDMRFGIDMEGRATDLPLPPRLRPRPEN